MFHSLLTGKRTAIVAPWEKTGQFAAHSTADASAAIVAYLQPRVLADVEECTGGWCLISGTGFKGWIEQERLWGVYPGREVRGVSAHRCAAGERSQRTRRTRTTTSTDVISMPAGGSGRPSISISPTRSISLPSPSTKK